MRGRHLATHQPARPGQPGGKQTRTTVRLATARRAALATGFDAVLAAPATRPSFAQGSPIRVGVLHPLSGTAAISETALRDAVPMVAKWINAHGGLRGRRVEAAVVDPASNWPLFAEKARELLQVTKVGATFGCWTSVTRKSVLPVFEELNGLPLLPGPLRGGAARRSGAPPCGASRCLRGVSLEADPGRITCVPGRNGGGKSSSMRSIAGLERAGRGRVLWEGRDVTAVPPSERARAGIGCVPQGREVLPFLSAQENLETALAAAPIGFRVPEEVFALFPFLKRFLHRRRGDLSGGQQQQQLLAIARALTARPRLLIFEEPTEGIQPSVTKDFARVIRLLARDRGLAVVPVEQCFEFAGDLADRSAVMLLGEVALGGPTDSLEDEAVRRLLTV